MDYGFSLPSSGGGTFTTVVEPSWHVDDPIACFRSETANVSARKAVNSMLADIAEHRGRPVTARFRHPWTCCASSPPATSQRSCVTASISSNCVRRNLSLCTAPELDPAPRAVLISSSVTERDAALELGLDFIGYAETRTGEDELRAAGCQVVAHSLMELADAAYNQRPERS